MNLYNYIELYNSIWSSKYFGAWRGSLSGFMKKRIIEREELCNRNTVGFESTLSAPLFAHLVSYSCLPSPVSLVKRN